MNLVTRDAHGIYEKFGFKPQARPEIFMEALSTNVFKNATKGRAQPPLCGAGFANYRADGFSLPAANSVIQ
jgi:hypothetical protein